jgi:RimJ/RimL family protein N-acetyltransferase
MNSQLRQSDLLRGALVRLGALDPETQAAHFARWSHDSEFRRLLDSDPIRPELAKHVQAEMEQRANSNQDQSFRFAIYALDSDRFIGFVSLWVQSWASAEAFIGIGIGERDYWSKGYGGEAMRLALGYAFHELNLERVSLEAFAENLRAIRSYEKNGFRLEGVQRQWEGRDGRRADVVSMGVLRDEWLALTRPAAREHSA